jgi:hypothetical protein
VKNREPQALLSSLLHQVLERHPAFSANPLGDWSDLVGEQVARNSQPLSLKKGVLVVVAYDSVWKHHLELLKQELTERINRHRKEPIVAKIVIRVGEVPLSVDAINPNYRLLQKMGRRQYRSKRRKRSPVRQLTTEEKQLLKSLPDPDLRTIGARLLRRIPASEA